MNNYISKENAIGLKEIGYDAPTATYYRAKSAYSDGTKIEIAHEPTNVNETSWYSAPDFLSAADWFKKAHGIMIAFYWHDTWLMEDGEVHTVKMRPSAGDDHRNAAIAHAILIVKERKK